LAGNSQYQFLPWTRRGLTTVIANDDKDNLKVRAKIETGITVNPGITAGITLSLYGPGDVVGIDPRMIVRTFPVANTRNAEANFFAACDFDWPDFVWMFTPAKANGNQQLNPWLVLIVLDRSKKIGRPKVKINRPLPSITIPKDLAGEELPDLKESWAWAHAQHMTSDEDQADLAGQLADNPDFNVSRLIAPRRLAPDREYMACLVPAFDAGVKRGLGRSDLPGPDENLKPAWDIDSYLAEDLTQVEDLELPVYYHWEFATGPEGDFESLAAKLTPFQAPASMGVAPMYVGDPGDPLVLDDPLSKDDEIILMDGVLAGLSEDDGNTNKLAEVPEGIVDGLRKVLNAPARKLAEEPGADPLLAPPIYGQWHRQEHRLAEDGDDWFHELNVDPRSRVAAGAGAEVVRKYQEDFMQQSWEQVGEVLKANNRLSWGRLGLEVSRRIFERHYRPLPTDRFLQMTLPLHRRSLFKKEVTILSEITNSSMPNALVDPAFRRLTSPQRPLIKKTVRRLGNRLVPEFEEEQRSLLAQTMAEGSQKVDPTQFTPDGLTSSVLLKKIVDDEAVRVEGIELDQVGARTLLSELNNVAVDDLKARDDVSRTGLVTEIQLEKIRLIGIEQDPETFTPFNIQKVVNGFLTAVKNNEDAKEIVAKPQENGNGPIFSVVQQQAPSDGNVVGGVIGGVAGPGSTENAPEDAGVIETDPPDAGNGPVVNAGAAAGEIREEAALQAATTIPVPEKDDTVGVFELQLQGAVNDFKLNVPATDANVVEFKIKDARQSVIKRIDPAGMVPQRMRQLVNLREGDMWEANAPDGPVVLPPTQDRVMASPILPAPASIFLAETAPGHFLPGANGVPENTMSVLETNPRFIEAFMVGLNTEMNRELLWRKYPTDQRGTPFRLFWDLKPAADGEPQADIEPLEQWDRELGDNMVGEAAGKTAVLLVRGELLQRYPNAVIWAWKANEDGDKLIVAPDEDEREEPIFQGRFSPDMSYAGFSRSIKELGDEWFFVLAEQPTGPRFGLDVGEKNTKPGGPVARRPAGLWQTGRTQMSPRANIYA
jgi:hypothetical protein